MGETLVRMPRLADTLVEGTVGQWLKQVGDELSQGEPLAAIETDKVTTEIASPASGTLLEILVAAGQTVPIETPIARIGTPIAITAAPPAATPAPPETSANPGAALDSPSAGPPSASTPSASTPSASTPSASTPSASTPSASTPSAGTLPAPKPTPVAARLLAEHGVAADQIVAQAGRITKTDVLRHLQSAAPFATEPTPRSPNRGDGPPRRGRGDGPLSDIRSDDPSGDRRSDDPSGDRRGDGPLSDIRGDGPPSLGDGVFMPLTSMRRAIAEHMTAAYQTIPHGQTVMAADLTQLVDWREANKSAFQRAEGANLTFTVLFVQALAKVLAEQQRSSVDLGIAVAIDGGLIVPVLRDAEALTLGATAQSIADLATRARAKKLAAEELQGAHMTLTNVGSFGNLTAAPIIPRGQLGILGPGLVERRPLPGPDGGVRLGWRCLLSLMFDRRRLDDFAADHFLRSVVDELERWLPLPEGEATFS